MKNLNFSVLDERFLLLGQLANTVSGLFPPLNTLLKEIDFKIVNEPNLGLIHDNGKTVFTELVKVDNILSHIQTCNDTLDIIIATCMHLKSNIQDTQRAIKNNLIDIV